MEAIEYFISKGHRAGLCLLNHNHKVSSGDDAGIEDIKELTQKIAETLNQPAPDLIFKNATVVNGKLEPRAPGPNPEDERIREQLITGLHAGRRVLVITAYPTLGRGVNIDHSPSPDEVLHTIGKRFRLDTVDLDFLYLVKKTNIIPNIYNHGSGSAFKKEDKLSLTYYAQALAEKGELSAQDCYRKTKSVWTGNKKDFARGIYNGPDFAWSQMESTTQGVGRLSRSDRKRPHTSVLLDPELAQALGPCRELPEDFMVSVPMSKILEASPPHTSAPDEDRLMRRAQNQTGKISKAIRDLLRAAQKGEEGARQFWLELRTHCLAFPGCDQLEDIPAAFRSYYMELPEPAASVSCEFEPHTRTFHPRHFSTIVGKSFFLMDGRHTGLTTFMKHPDLRQWFAEQGWCTEWRPWRHLLHPEILASIYQAAIGEVTGRWLMQSQLNLPLEDLPGNSFEKFDGYHPVGIYVDFKNWSDRTHVDREEAMAKISQKVLDLRDDPDVPDPRALLYVNARAKHNPGAWKPRISRVQDTPMLEVPQLFKADGSVCGLPEIQKFLKDHDLAQYR